MNSTIKQYSGPSSTAKAKGLPKAAKKFAQQMGLDLTGLEAEAEDMWEMLNKMSVEEPIAYENFVEEQMRQQKAEESIPEDEKTKGRMFRPQAGFCIKCRTTGNDGIKVRDFGTNSGKDLYLNFVSHEAIEPPKDRSGRPVLDDRGASADGLELPLLIGPLRDVDSETLAVDVVLHPVVLARSDTYNLFRSQVIDLALEWTTQEVGVLYSKKYEVVPWKYHGGRGADKSTPVLFPVDEVLDRQASGNKVKAGSKDALLDTIKVEKQKDNLLEMASSSSTIDATPSIIMGKTPKDNMDMSKKSVGIQEMREDGTFEPPPVTQVEPKAHSKSKTKKKAAPAVKKGFLNDNKKKSLYPEGSSEGQNGGVYTRLMSRCTVVDTANMAQQGSGGGGGSFGNAPPAPPPQQAPSSQTQVPMEETEEVTSKRPALSINEQNEIDAMYSGLDLDFATSLTREQKSKETDNFLTSQLADFAKALAGPNGPNREKDEGLDEFKKQIMKSQGITTAATAVTTTAATTASTTTNDSTANDSTAKVCKVNNKLPKHITTTVEISGGEGSAPKKNELRITVNNVDKSQLKETDLQVSERKVMIVVPSNNNLNADGLENKGGSVQIIPPFSCNVKTVKAAMSKKKKTIEITVTEC